MADIKKLNNALSRYWFVGIVFFITGFIYLKSPFNQKMISPEMLFSEYNFIKISFLLYLIWGILFLVLLYFIRKKYENLIYPFLLWNIGFFLLMSVFNLGFDITDEGWQLAKSWGILHGDLQNNSDLIWGSSFVSGLWMAIINKPLLLWSRLGFLLFIPFFAPLIYSILKDYFPKEHVFFSATITFLLFYRHFLTYNIVNYYYLPVFASLLSFLYLSKFHRSEKFSLKFLILSGVFAGISIHLKFTYLLIIPLILVYFYSFYEKKSKNIKSTAIFYSSLFGALLLGFLILLIFGGVNDLIYEHNRLSIFNMFSYFLGGSTPNSSLNYSAPFLLNLHIRDLIAVVKESLLPFTIFFIGSYLVFKNSRLKYFIIIFIGIVLYLFLQHNPSDSHIKTISIISSASVLILFFSNNNKSDFIFLNFIFISVFSLSLLGSGLSFYSGLISLGFFGFTALTLAAILSYKTRIISIRILFFSILFLALTNQFTKSYSPYRDLPSPYLNTMFKSPELFGIYSFKERVEVVDEFIAFSKDKFSENDKIIIVSMPMLYYILDVKPIISETHDVILGFDQLKQEVETEKPNIIILPVQSPRGHFWPLEKNKNYWKEDGFERNTAHYYDFYRNYISENNFIQIFANNMFIMYKKPI